MLLPNLQVNQSGLYSVLAVNAAGSVKMPVANVNVLATCTPAPSDLVAWWGGDQNSLDSFAANHGSISGGVTYTNGMVRQAFAFDGASGAITVPDSASLNISSALTLEGWVNLNDTNQVKKGSTVLKSRHPKRLSAVYVHGRMNAYRVMVIGRSS